MAESIYKVATGSTGAGGTPIYDVFEGTRKLELPEFQQRGLNIDHIQVGTAPTGFQSQFEPIKLNTGTVPTKALEAGITKADLDAMLAENQKTWQSSWDAQQRSQADLLSQTLAKMQLTPEEKMAQERILGLQQLQQQAVQRVQERPLDGTMLRGGLESEIQNISTGNTRESLVNLRQQTFEAQRLNLLQEQRKQELEALKLQLDQGNINSDNLFKYQELQRAQQNDYLDRVQQLGDTARTNLATILETFKGLTLNNLSPQNLAQVARLAEQAGIPLDMIRDGMQVVADQIKAEQDLQRYEAETARINATKKDTTTTNGSQVEGLQTKLTNIGNLLTHPGMTGTVGTYGISRWTPLTPDKAAKTDFIAGVEQLISQDTLNTLINLKAQGGTLGALSDGEREMLQKAASKISTWRLTDSETGKVYGYETSEENFIKELGEIQRLTELAIKNAGGTINLNQDDIDEVNSLMGNTGIFNPANFYSK